MRSRFLFAVCIVAWPLSQASAAPLPAATYEISLENGPTITVPGTFTTGGEIGEIQNAPAPLAHAHVAGQGTSRAILQYWFRVVGPAANLPVPIQISGEIQIDAGGAVFRQNMVWGVTAQLNAQALDGPLAPGVGEVDSKFSTVDCSPTSVGPIPVTPPIGSCPATSQDQAVLLALNTLSGADNRVTLVAAANNQESFSASFDALVDPLISFAPGFDSTGYSILLSDDVGNAVPEPSSALLVTPAMVVLLRLRRSKKSRRSS
ncbi:MAG TPA: hypothetical protein VMW35_02115 [Myxococcota bacterium]|nr:hypothetical protein [Myxococcota bacterium]